MGDAHELETRAKPTIDMRHLTTLAFFLTAGLAACGGDSGITTPPPPQASVLLKEISVANLPAPFYHFDYDGAGVVTSASFAAGFRVYTMVYDGGRLSEMRNDAVGNLDRIQYFYDDAGRVSSVNYVDGTGVVFAHVSLTYDGSRLTRLERERLFNGAFIVDKTMTLTYYPDGNLLEVAEHFPAIEGLQTESATTDLFERYDNGINVDDFGLIHDEFFDNWILLPGVRLQKGNPAKTTHLGDGDNFTVDYTYTYDDRNRPLVKSGDLLFTTGPDAGQHFQTQSAFSYY
ncbi:MAG: hypothetical protein ACRENK_08740 [Gemmatimonadaceae bacterium]